MAAGVSDELEMLNNSETNSSSGSDNEVESSSSAVTSILDKLRAPKRSELARKRKVATNKNGGGGKRRRVKTHSSSSEPKSISPHQRLKQFPNENLTVSAKKLFCEACKEEVSLKCSSIRNHVKCRKSKEALTQKQAREKDIAVSLKEHNEETHLKVKHYLSSSKFFESKSSLHF